MADDLRARAAERQKSRVRIAELEVAILRAVGVVLAEHEDELTYEEICVALNEVQRTSLQHLLNDEES